MCISAEQEIGEEKYRIIYFKKSYVYCYAYKRKKKLYTLRYYATSTKGENWKNIVR